MTRSQATRSRVADVVHLLLDVRRQQLEATTESGNHVIGIGAVSHVLHYSRQLVYYYLKEILVAGDEALAVTHDLFRFTVHLTESFVVFPHVRCDDAEHRFLEGLEA